MVGKNFIIRGVFTLLLCLTATVIQAQPAEGRWVAVILSNSEIAFDPPARSFTDSMNYTVRTFNLENK